MLNYPSVCTEAPQHGKAFCKQHVEYLERKHPELPTDIRGFLKHCGVLQSNKGDYQPLVIRLHYVLMQSTVLCYFYYSMRAPTLICPTFSLLCYTVLLAFSTTLKPLC